VRKKAISGVDIVSRTHVLTRKALAYTSARTSTSGNCQSRLRPHQTMPAREKQIAREHRPSSLNRHTGFSGYKLPKLTRRSASHLSVLAGHLFLISLGAWQLSAPTVAHAQADSSRSVQRPAARQLAPSAAGTPAVRVLFRQHCVKCHGTDGTGSPARDRLPQIPDFTAASWQARRNEAQLLASILDGKGTEMPPARDKISEEQARGLMAFVRAFAPATEKSQQEEQAGPAPTFTRPGQDEQEGPARGEPAEAQPPEGFLEKLIRWLGKFHPPTVHFPIALLIAAALAQLLRMATGKPAFDAVSRYCVWLSAVTAVVAGVLGWFRCGFGLSDASWVLTTHRWFGTSTVACAGLVLALSEVSCRPDRRRTRMWFRVALFFVAVLVLVTGFFGGAMVFGLDHYTWPA
jgi:uncharacterized membrane protein/mono/diheme cytochrome c family protein